ncbi:MAG: DUF3857 domain-containing protein, partial [Chitinophagales bacterium]|nr:DUF3857 domain-containing protein [Chitinophagales bacterium]
YYADKIQILSKKQEVEEIIKTANKAYDLYPMDWQFVVLKYYLEKEVKKNVAAGVKVVKKYAKARYNSEAINILVENAFSNGDVNGGIKEFERLIDANPLATGYYSRLSSIYFSLGNYTKAREMTEKCLEIAPYVGSYHSSLASAYEEMGEDEKAEAGYLKAIKYDPYDYEAREMLRNLRDEKDIFTYMTDFENYEEFDIYEIYKNSPDGDAYPEDNSLIMLDEVQKVVYAGGGSEERHALGIKVFNSSGVDRWKEYYISLFGNQSGVLEKAEVLKKNGSKLTAEQSGSQLVFTNLEPGDAIYLVYKVQNYYSGKLTNHFWDKHHIESYFPKLHSRFSLMVPKGRKFSYEVLNGNTEPSKSNDDNFDFYTWNNKDVASIKYEPYMPDISDVGEVLHISSFDNWDYVAKWYAGLAQAKSKADFEVQETVAELFKGKEGMSDLDKVKEIYNYITQNIRYSSVSFIQSGLVPQKASRVINAKQGDCKDVSTLFVAMCKTQGIDANLVLVNTRDNGRYDMTLPSIAFNHCIAKVNLPDASYYLELTGENLPFASGSSSLKNAFVLEIPKDPSVQANAEIINPPTRTPNNTTRISQITFDGDLMKVRKETFKTGTKASSMRNSYKNEGKETQFKYMQEAINGLYPNMKLVVLEFIDGLTDNSKTIHYKYGYDVPEVFSELSGLSIFKLPWADGWKSPDFISAEKRNFPIELWKYFTGEYYEETLTIQPPAGKTFSDIPSNLTLSNAYIDYSIVYQKQGNNLKVTRKFIIKDDKVKKEDYTAFKTFFGKIVKSDEQNLAFK